MSLSRCIPQNLGFGLVFSILLWISSSLLASEHSKTVPPHYLGSCPLVSLSFPTVLITWTLPVNSASV